MLDYFKVPPKGAYYLIENSPQPNKFIELTKAQHAELNNLEDLHDTNHINDDIYESVKNTFEKLHRKQIYVVLNW